jgi:cytochrome c2
MTWSMQRVSAAALAAWLVTTPLAAAPAGAEDPLALARRGKEAFAAQCLGCHQTVEEAAAGYLKTPAWREVVADMVARGAKLDPAQQEAVAEYLTGRSQMIAKCSSCHSAFRALTAAKSIEGWKATVDDMVRRMPADLRPNAEQAGRIAVFLAVERPAR